MPWFAAGRSRGSFKHPRSNGCKAWLLCVCTIVWGCASGTSGTAGSAGAAGIAGVGGIGVAAGGSIPRSDGTGGATHSGGANTGGSHLGGTGGARSGSGGSKTGGTTGSGGSNTGGVYSGGTGGSGASSSGGAGTPSANDAVVNVSDLHQEMDGFGAADVGFGSNSNTLTDAQADLFFSADKGIGLSLLRIGIDPNGNDWAAWSNATKAVARGAKVWAAPWSAPAQWKDNNSATNGGHLCAAAGQGSCTASHYADWASRLAGFAASLKANAGVDLYALSAQNEPDYTATWESMDISNSEMVAFIKVLGPKLAALSPRPKLLAPESSNWSDLWGYGNAILGDATASSYTDFLATHDYTYSPQPHAVVAKHVWETEVSTFDNWDPSIGGGITVAKWMYNAIVTGNVSAWHYWWLISLGDDNQGLINSGQRNTPPASVQSKRLYAMGNFSKFVRPGYQRVGVSGAVPSGVHITAFRSASSGAIAIIAINENGASVPISVFVSGSSWPTAVTPWTTTASDNLSAKSPLRLAGARFSTTLAAQSITTFAG